MSGDQTNTLSSAHARTAACELAVVVVAYVIPKEDLACPYSNMGMGEAQ